MKTKPSILAGRPIWLWRPLAISSLLSAVALIGRDALGADILWTSTASLGAGQWTNTTDWVGGVIPGIHDIADFNTSQINGNANITVNDNPVSTLQVGAVTVGSSLAASFRITSQSTAVNPTTLSLNGVGGILLSNESSSFQLQFTNASAGSPPPGLNLALASNGVIYCYNSANNNPPITRPADSSGGEIVIYSVITGPGSFTNAGPGILYFGSASTYSGSTTLANGTLELGGAGTIGNGSGTVYFTGGNLETGGSSTTRTINNPFVINTPGNAYIYNASGTAGTRIFALSNTISGTSGTLVLGNANTTVGEFLDVQMLGSFTFNLPLVVGDNLGDAYSDNPPSDYSELQLANSAGTGPQTFNGNISGDGPIFRGNVSASVSVAGDNGVTIFTGNNTYTGGTTINNGTLFANNTAGSALGSGQVTVTNLGILGGNGTIAAPTSVNNNGIIQPGSTSTTVGNLTLSSGLTFNPGAKYEWQISAATGTAGTAWDLITASSGWTDAGSSTTPITIYVNSEGLTPTGWNDASSYSWMLIANNGSGTGFNPSDWAVNTTGFAAPLAGVFGVTSDVNGDLLLTYTPSAGNDVIDVETGSVTQGGVSPTPYPLLLGPYTVTKVGNGEVIMTNSLNSYQGATYIDAGTASAAVNSTTSGGAFGASTAPLVLGYTTGNSNATLNIDQPGVSVANAVTVQAGSSGVKTIGSTMTSGDATYSGNVTLLDNVTLSAAPGGSNYFSGNFSGAGGVTFSGGGTIAMAGVGTYTGPTLLTGDALDLDASALGTNTFTISAPSTLDNTSGGSVTLANNPPEYWNADFNFVGTENLNLGAGPVTMSANRTLNVSNSVLTVGGTIAGTGCGLTLVGPGELSLAGPTNSTYNGGTTNLGGTLGINATATFGDGTGTLVFSDGGNLLDTGTRAIALPIANPVIFNTNTRIYGNSTDTAAPNRYLPFIGAFTVAGGSTLYIDNIGSAKTIFDFTLEGTNYTTINWPIVIGDSTFDTAGALTTLNLLSDNTTPVQTISSVVTGTGSILRGANVVNTGGTTILTAQNTFSGGVQLLSGTIGFGASSTLSGGAIVSGPLGTGEFTWGDQTAESNLTVFAIGGPVEIDNPMFFNGDTNMVFAGTNNMLFTGGLNSGGVAKFLTVVPGITVTLAGPITNTGSSSGGPLTEVGGGTLIFSGANTYAGTTTVNAGKLLVNGSNGTNTVTANLAGVVGGAGSLGGNLTFASTGSQAYLYKTAGSPDSPLMVAGNLTLDGNTVIVDLGGTTTLGPGTYTLLNYAGALSGSFATVPTLVNGTLAAGNGAMIDLSTTNEVNLIVGPASTVPPGFMPGSISYVPASGVSLIATGAIGATYHLWATTNIALKPVTTTWTLLGSGTVTSSPFTNYDMTATNYPQRFYLFTTP